MCVCVLGGSGFVARRSAPSPGLNDINDIKTLITNMKATGQIQIYLAGRRTDLCVVFYHICSLYGGSKTSWIHDWSS